MYFSRFISLLPLVSAVTLPPRSLVVWHGLGDAYASPGMLEFVSIIQNKYPGIYVHSVYIDEDLEADKKATFYGDANAQIDLVAQQISSIPELSAGFDAIGFSQGGQFLRAYVERFNNPPVRNLITFGSQHMGIADIPTCKPMDFLCQIARRAVKSAVYSSWSQTNLIQAQYFRNPYNLDEYLTANKFLTSINNEIPGARNATYAKNLASLENLVLVLFSEDETVVPKESAWFGAIEVDDGKLVSESGAQHLLAQDADATIVPMREQPLYTEDWIGLRALDKAGRVKTTTCKGQHMQLNKCWEDIVHGYIGRTTVRNV